jgi:hypothetical protein
MAMATKHAFVRATGRQEIGGLFGTLCGCNAVFSESVELEPLALFIVGIQATTATVLP